MMKNGLLIVLVFVLTAAEAVAQAQAQREGLSGRVALGYLATSGNSESESLSLNFSGDYYGDAWHHKLAGRAVRASTSGVTTAESDGLSWQSDREFDNDGYVFVRAAWDRNEFGGYAQQIREVVGYGRHFIDSERHRFNGEIGLGLRQSDLRDGTSEDESIARLSADYRLALNESAELKQAIGVESGSDNTYTESVTSLSTDVWGNLAVVLSYTVKRNSNVPIGTVKRDTFTAVSLEYSF